VVEVEEDMKKVKNNSVNKICVAEVEVNGEEISQAT